ncbi:MULTISPECIES: hypothetical protein [Legionella]|uniref:Transmembrane protein n=1 Tax=Legionella maceachernii TaxID=466 RepID=A0A0W0W6P5_9GAMM|nr:hypothetical protein [Legionella maceachernii]KTD28028.1 hypothetical protein Lmac_1087 [Legionella maceachernii]SKA07112.1 hypothetical protein SAMN02745128_01976 [Legionella maceachernii]SUO99845.1 Uncharacterised protein [Legionella maceachernii]
MNGKLERLFENLVPFLLLGIAVALVIGLFIMFSYVLMWGFLIGLVMWAIYSVKNLLFPRQASTPPVKRKGRIIEHNDQD